MARELDRYRDCDPQAMEELRSQIQVAVDAANRWTGQLTYFTLKTVLTSVYFSSHPLPTREHIYREDMVQRQIQHSGERD